MFEGAKIIEGKISEIDCVVAEGYAGNVRGVDRVGVAKLDFALIIHGIIIGNRSACRAGALCNNRCAVFKGDNRFIYIIAFIFTGLYAREI